MIVTVGEKNKNIIGICILFNKSDKVGTMGALFIDPINFVNFGVGGIKNLFLDWMETF